MRPFVWQHLLLPLVPNSYLEVLDAPIPVLVGLPKKMRRGKAGHEHIVWVLLDHPGGKVQMDESLRREIFEPYADDMKRSIAPVYARIVSKGQTYPSSEDVVSLACDIAKGLTEFWERILKELPLETPMDKEGEYIDEEQISRAVMAQFPDEDRPFLGHFLRSQAFLTHVEDRKVAVST